MCGEGSIERTGLTPQVLRTRLAALAAHAPDVDAAELVGRIRAWFGERELRSGPLPKVDELTVAWAVEVSGTRPWVASDDGAFTLPLARVGDSDVHAAVATLPWGTAMRWHYEVGDAAHQTLTPPLDPFVAAMYGAGGAPLEVYTTHPDSVVQPGVPTGTVTGYRAWPSAVFPGTTRDWWLYVPAQYRPDEPACLMVFQDGAQYVAYVPTVFDNLIARGDMPVTVGVFVSPGQRETGTRRLRIQIDGMPQPPLETRAPQRNLEYDTCSDTYARFLLGDILPEVARTVNLHQDPKRRAIAGISSGATCAFTVAWERPDAFGRVLSWCGSFTNLASLVGRPSDLARGPAVRSTTAGLKLRRSGHDYPSLIRMTPPKPIKVILQDGDNDLDMYAGNWWLANQEMARALAFAGYDHAVSWGHGYHSDKHGRAILPDSLRELWRGWGSRR